MALTIKRVPNLPPHLSYVSTLPDITQKPKNLCCFYLNSVSGYERHRFWCVSGSEKSRLCVSFTVGV